MKVLRTLCWLTAGMSFGIVHASTASITITGTSLGQSISFLKNGVAHSGYAGGIVINVNGASSSALCVDLFTNLAVNDTFQVNLYQSQYLNPSQTDRGLKAAYLFLTQYGTRTSVVTTANPSITLNQAMAALQLAVWDIVHDGGNGLSTGNVRSSGSTNAAVAAAAASYIQFSLNYQQYGPINATLYQHVNGPLTKQQLMGVYQPGTGPGIPEPTSYLLMGSGLGVLAWCRGRRKTTQ